MSSDESQETAYDTMLFDELNNQDWSKSYLALGALIPGRPESEHSWLTLDDEALVQLINAIRAVPHVNTHLIAVAEWAESVLMWKSKKGGVTS